MPIVHTIPPLGKRAKRLDTSKTNFNNTGMTQKEYLDSRASLAPYFSHDLVNRLVDRPHSKSAVFEVIKVHSKLSSDAYGRCSPKEIVRMAARHGGINNIRTYMTHYQKLVAPPYSLSKKQIIKIASHNGGSCNLQATIDNYMTLKGLNFNQKQIVRMLNQDGGSSNIQAVIKGYNKLRELNFTTEQIVQLVSHNGGSIHVNLVCANKDKLLLRGWTAKKIIEILGRGAKGRDNFKQQIIGKDSLPQLTRDNFDWIDTFFNELDTGITEPVINPFNDSVSVANNSLLPSFQNSTDTSMNTSLSTLELPSDANRSLINAPLRLGLLSGFEPRGTESLPSDFELALELASPSNITSLPPLNFPWPYPNAGTQVPTSAKRGYQSTSDRRPTFFQAATIQQKNNTKGQSVTEEDLLLNPCSINFSL